MRGATRVTRALLLVVPCLLLDTADVSAQQPERKLNLEGAGIVLHKSIQPHYSALSAARESAANAVSQLKNSGATAFAFEELIGDQNRMHWFVLATDSEGLKNLPKSALTADAFKEELSVESFVPESLVETILHQVESEKHNSNLTLERAGAVLFRTARARDEAILSARKWAQSLCDVMNEKHGDIVRVVSFEGPKNQLYWLLLFKDLQGYIELRAVIPENEEFRTKLAPQDVWGELFIDGSIQDQFLMPVGLPRDLRTPR